MTTISIAMATYNGARFIREQLDSLAAQTYLPMELVVTDDGSTDATLEIIADFAKTAPFPVRVHQNEERLGYKANFMKCANLCAGDLIAFCDQDDVWLSHKLATQLCHFDNPKIFLSTHSVVIIDQDGNHSGKEFSRFNKTKSFAFANVGLFSYSEGFTQTFRRSLLNFSFYWELSIDHQAAMEKMAHDQWFFFLALVIGQVHYDAKKLALYRQHDTNTSGMKMIGKVSIRTKIDVLFADRLPQYECLIMASQKRRDILCKIMSYDINKKLISGELDEINFNIKQASIKYTKISYALQRRYLLYRSNSNFIKMAKMLSVAIVKGDYRLYNSVHNFSFFGLLRDFVYVACKSYMRINQ